MGLEGQDIGLEEVGDGIWNIVYYTERCSGRSTSAPCRSPVSDDATAV